MRKSIFEIISESYDIGTEIERMKSMTMQEKVLYVGHEYKYTTLFEFVDDYCFKHWRHRGHCVDVVDFLETINFNELVDDAEENYESFMTIIEVIYNFWQQVEYRLTSPIFKLKTQGNFYHLKDVLDNNLDRFNHIAHVDIVNDLVLVIENKPEITAAAEYVDETLSLEVVRYNHRSLRGNLEEKKKILLAFAADLEPRRKEISQINKKLEDDIFFMLNNLNIRHNNRSKKDKNYKNHVANMKKVTLEKWYDELYQMILLAYLSLEQAERTKKVDELKRKIVETK